MERLEHLKSHAGEKIEHSNQVLLQVKAGRDVEIAKLNALLRRTEMRVANLEQTMKQKTDENKDLANICDELIHGKFNRAI